MASASTLTSVAYIVKKLYAGKGPENLAVRDRPLLKMLSKRDGFTGSNLTVPVRYGNPQGVGNVFATAQSNAASSKGIAWTITRVKKYGVATIDAEFIHATSNDEGAFIRGIKDEIDGTLDEMGRQSAIELYGDASGAIGRRSSISSNTVTLTNADDAKNFSVGQTIVADDTAAGTSLRSGSTTVTAVDEDAGTVTLASAAAITSFADNDYLFNSGNQAAAVTGLASWLPLTAPTAGDSHFGVDRSVDVGKLAGWRVNSTSSSMEENAITLAARIQRAGGRPKVLFVNPTNWATLDKQLGSKVMRDQGGTATMGFSSIKLATGAGIVDVVADPDCPTNRGYMLDLSSWYIRHLKGFPHVVMDDGQDSLRQASDDGVEVRCRQWWQLVCTAPGHNGVMAI